MSFDFGSVCACTYRAGPHGNEHGRTLMYVVYNKLQAIPEFLITYEWLGSDSDSD